MSFCPRFRYCYPIEFWFRFQFQFRFLAFRSPFSLSSSALPCRPTQRVSDLVINCVLSAVQLTFQLSTLQPPCSALCRSTTHLAVFFFFFFLATCARQWSAKFAVKLSLKPTISPPPTKIQVSCQHLNIRHYTYVYKYIYLYFDLVAFVCQWRLLHWAHDFQFFFCLFWSFRKFIIAPFGVYLVSTLADIGTVSHSFALRNRGLEIA